MNKKWQAPVRRMLALLLCATLLVGMFPVLDQGAKALDTDAGLLWLDGKVDASTPLRTKAYLDRYSPYGYNDNIVSGSKLLIRNADYGYVMSYSPVRSNATSYTGSMTMDQDGDSVGAFYEVTEAEGGLQKGQLYFDPSSRNEALWIIRQMVDSSGNKLTNEQLNDGKTMQAYTDSFVEMVPMFGGKIIPGVHLQKGSTSGQTDAYWYSDGVNNDSTLFRHLCLRIASAGSRPFTSTYLFNEQLQEEWTPRGYIIEMLSDGTCLIYFRMNWRDMRVLNCDENGIWKVKRYQYPEEMGNSEAAAAAIILADKGNTHRLYGYSDTSSTRKSLSYKGYTQYNLAKGITTEEVLEIISENLTVFDPDHRNLHVPYESDDGKLIGSGKAGYYRLQLPSGFSATREGTYKVNIVYNCLESGVGVSNTTIGSVTVNILEGTASITNTTGVVSKNAVDSFAVYPYEKATEAAYFTFTAGSRAVQVPIQLGMLRTASGDRVDTSKSGTYTNLVLTYNGITVTRRFTLTVSDTTLKADQPVYPAPGAVDVNKVTTTSQDDFFQNGNGDGVANIQLSVKGKTSTKGVDLIVIMDLSSSMRYAVDGNVEVAKNNTDTVNWPKTRLYKMEEALKSMIRQMQDDDMDIRIAMADFGDLDHFEFEDAVLDKAHRSWPQIEMVGGQAGEQYSGNNTASKFFAVNYNTEIANHLNFVLGKGDKELGAEVGLNAGQGISQAFYLHPYKYDNNMVSGFTGKILPKIYTGSEKLNADAFVDVNTLGDSAMSYIIQAIDDQNQNMLGTNYDVGLEYAYRLAYARQQENIAKGEDRMVTCIFMSDGAAMQYNYFSGRAHSESWSQYLVGNTDEILENHEKAAKWNLNDYDSLHPDLKWVIERMRQMMHNGQLWFVDHNAGENPNGKNGSVGVGHASPDGLLGGNPQYPVYWPGPDGDNCGSPAANGNGCDFPGAFYGHNSGFSLDWYDIFELIYENRSNMALTAAPNPIGKTGNEFYQALIQRLREPGYTTGYGHVTGSTNEWSVDDQGNVTSGINTFYNSRYQYQTYSPYWYFYNTEGKNWWAEAIKGDTGEVYPVINRHAGKTTAEWKGDLYTGEVNNHFVGTTVPDYMRGKNYISGFKGLGMDIYTIGFAITADDNRISAEEAKTVLKTVATRPAMFYDTNDTTSLTDALHSIIASATNSATASWFTDTMGGHFDLLTGDNADGKNVVPVITLKEYAVNADGTRGALVSTWETITFGGKGVAYLNGNTSVDIWDNDGGIRGEYLYFNTNKTGSIYLENLRGTGLNYTLAPETFFWSVGSVSENEMVMEYQVYLVGSVEDELPNIETVYPTNEEAIFHYRDELGNMVAHETVSPERSWYETATYKAGIYLVDANGIPLKANGSHASGITDALKLGSHTASFNTPNDPTYTHVTASDIFDILGLDPNLYEIYTPGTEVLITSDKTVQNHDMTISDSGNVKTTYIARGQSNKNDIDNVGLAKNEIYFAVKLKDYQVPVNYGIYLVDGNGNPILTDGTSASGVSAAALGSGSMNVTVAGNTSTTTLTVEEVLNELGLSGDAYEIFSPGSQVSITSNKFDRTHNMVITDRTNPKTTMIGNATTNPGTLSDSQLSDNKIWFAVKLTDFSALVNYGIYLVDKDGNPINTDGTDAANPGDAVLNSGNMSINVSDDITNTTLTVENALEKLGLSKDIYEIYSPGSKVDITSNKATGLHDVDVTDNTNPQTTYVGDDTNDKDDLNNGELANNDVLFAVRLKDYDVTVNYGIYLVDSNGNPIKADGTAASGPDAAALNSGSFEFTVDDHNASTGLTVEEAFELLGLSKDAYEIFSNGSEVTITAEKFDRTYQMEITDNTVPNTTMIGNSTNAPAGAINGTQLESSKIWFAVKLTPYSANVNYHVYLVDKDGNPIKTNGSEASAPADAVLNSGNLVIDVTDDITNTTLTVEDAVKNLGLSDDIYEIVSVGSKVDIASDKATGLHDVDITDNADPKTTFVGEDTNNKDDLDTDELNDNDVYFAVRLKDYDVPVNYGIYLVDSNGNPILTDGTLASGPDAAALGSGSFQFTVDEHNASTGITVEEAFELLGLSKDAYEIFSNGSEVTITAEKYDRTYQMVIVDNTQPNTTMIGNSTDAPAGAIDGTQLESSKIWFAVKLTPFTTVVNYGIYLVDQDGNPIKPDGEDASDPADAVLKDGNLSINVSDDITNTTLTVEEILEKLGLSEDIYEIYSPGSQVDITSNKATGLHDVDITDNTDPQTTYVGDDTNDKDDLNNGELANNDVLFAVKLKNRGSSDTVVVDYGLSVDIDVLANDGFGVESTLVGYQTPASYGSAVTVPNASANVVTGIATSIDDAYATVTINGILSRWQVKDMLFSNYYQYAYCAQDSVTGHHYWSSVTVIPATSIYYEDNFVAFNQGDLVTEGWSWADWSISGDVHADTQNQDRPGSLGAEIDADKIYGNDDAYTTTETFSGASRWTQVTPTSPARASFTFTGTGFDVVSFTGKTTGTVMVFIYDAETFEKFDDPSTVAFDGSQPEQVLLVNSFYSLDDGLYQVPVIKCTDLAYGTYVVELLIAYDEWFNEGQYGEEEKFDFCLDSVRIYNPAGIVSDGDDNTIYDAYTQDGERWPRYQELRNMILAPQVVDGKVTSTEDISGMLFIDNYKLTGDKITYSNYKAWGPNNEVYLNTDDAVFFKLNTTKYLQGAFNDADDVALADVDQIHLALRALKGTSKVKIASGSEEVEFLVSANDQYFDITGFANKNVVISVTGENAVSVTNIKITHTAMPSDYLVELGQPTGRRAMMLSKAIDFNAPSMASLITVNGADANELLVELNKGNSGFDGITPMYASLSFKDLIHCNIYFQADDFAAKDLGLLVFNGNAVDGTVDTAAYIVGGAVASNGMYRVSTQGIPAKNLGDTIYFKLYARLADGSYAYTKLLTYSPLEYASYLLTAGTDMDKTLAAAMLNYGAEAQKYFGYNTDTLMNNGVTEEAKALLAGYSINDLDALDPADPAKVGAFTANGGFEEIYPSVSFKGAFSINYYFRPANAVEGDLTFYYWTEDTYNSVTELTADNADSIAVLNASNGLYRAVSGQIVAKGLDKTVYAAAVYQADGVTYCTGVLAYSVAEYTRAFANGIDRFAPFANATAIYGSVAKAYFCN